MKVYGRSDIGMLRQENQDAFGVCPLQGGALLSVVCDGMGGESGGKEAADTCVSTFLSAYNEKNIPTAEDLADTLLSANTEILAKRDKNGYARMGTTVVLALATEQALTLLWAGDSRAYLLHGDALSRLTRDHSYVQALVDGGKIPPEEARTHPKRNLITRAVGVSDTVEPDTLTLAWSEGDRLLLCSDGLYGMVEEKELLEILSEEHTVERTAHELICAANSHGGEDNITVLLLENTKENHPDA